MTRPFASRLTAARADGERGSIVLAMLVTLVATSVAALIVPVLITSTKSTSYDTRRVQQLAAAQSGVQAVVARIRAAADTSANGLLNQLPCGDVLGNVLGSSTLRYKANVQYYKSDPSLLKSAADLATNLVKCVTGAGVIATPPYARITAWGTDVATGDPSAVANRQVQATYVVKTNNANIVGGLFRVNKLDGKQDLCLTAATATPTAGSTVALSMQVCDATKATQKWAYNKTLTVSLVATRVLNSAGVATTEGWCVDGSASPETTNTVLVAKPCGTTSTAPQQMWSMNDNAGMQGTDNGSSLNSLCWGVQSENTAGSAVVLQGQCSGNNNTYDNVHSWVPEPAVGAGASGATYGELVNYKQFGRCLDVTDQNVNSSYLIAWPCKQQPDPTKVAWNQRWTLPAVDATSGTGVGQISTTVNGTTYCLTSPLKTGTGYYVTVQPCSSAPAAAVKWTVYTNTGTYATSYRIEDWSGAASGKGLCLGVTDLATDPFPKATNVSKVSVFTCSGSDLGQKWNAPPNIDAPSVKDQSEN